MAGLGVWWLLVPCGGRALNLFWICAGTFFRCLAALNGLGHGLGFVRRNAAGLVLAIFPDLMFEIGAAVMVWMPKRGAGFGLERTAFHVLNLLHLLEELLAFVKKGVHRAIMTSY